MNAVLIQALQISNVWIRSGAVAKPSSYLLRGGEAHLSALLHQGGEQRLPVHSLARQYLLFTMMRKALFSMPRVVKNLAKDNKCLLNMGFHAIGGAAE